MIQSHVPYLTVDPDSLTEEQVESFKSCWRNSHPGHSFEEIRMPDKELRKFLGAWLGALHEMKTNFDKYGDV